MTLGDEVFGGGSIPPSTKYVVTWIGMGLSVLVAVCAWFVPAEDLAVPAGRWLISLLGLVLFTFALCGNRYFRRRMDDEGRAQESSTPR
ncbi:hypothetical protein [Geodermatophilus sp. DSM 44513]|uniref:hypothetical protein n=1 Tax=Geodermatophilus sp. DSM 44513 TaxID=1528104 RepID=UPI0014129728|nr:hypothetical protein [Geodermatophilus sp. DSM 44513]WNV73720.1 hypothetical protein RTG05_12070 [Geodermatophilus sp. DSM 44513]